MGEYAAAKTSVWWDIENCAVPRSCDPQLLVQNMSSALATAGYSGPITISAYGDTNGIAHHVQQALSSTGISLNHVPARIKDASDKKILVDMLIWAIDNPPPANYLLISGDRDFSNALYKLKMRRYNILLAQPPNVSQTLTTVAKSVWLWKSLVDGEPPLLQSPYISSTRKRNTDTTTTTTKPSKRNTDGLDKSKNVVSGPSDTTQPNSPQVQNKLPCDHQESGNGKAHQESGNRKAKATGASDGLTASGGVQKKNRRCRKNSKLKHQKSQSSVVPRVNTRPEPGQGLMCFKCGADHKASECSWSGPCQHCGVRGHMGRVCKQNPASIIRWCESPSSSAPAAPSPRSAAAQPSAVLSPQAPPQLPAPPAQASLGSMPTAAASSAPASSHGPVQAFKAAAAAQPSAAVLCPPQGLCPVPSGRPQLPVFSAQAPLMFYSIPTATSFSVTPAASSHGSVQAFKAVAAAHPSAFWGAIQGLYRPTVPSTPPQLPARPAQTSIGFYTMPTATSSSAPVASSHGSVQTIAAAQPSAVRDPSQGLYWPTVPSSPAQSPALPAQAPLMLYSLPTTTAARPNAVTGLQDEQMHKKMKVGAEKLALRAVLVARRFHQSQRASAARRIAPANEAMPSPVVPVQGSSEMNQADQALVQQPLRCRIRLVLRRLRLD